MTNFVSKNKAAQLQQRLVNYNYDIFHKIIVVSCQYLTFTHFFYYQSISKSFHVVWFMSISNVHILILCRDGNELSTRDLQKMVQALPQYNEQMERLSTHVAVVYQLKLLKIITFNLFLNVYHVN